MEGENKIKRQIEINERNKFQGIDPAEEEKKRDIDNFTFFSCETFDVKVLFNYFTAFYA